MSAYTTQKAQNLIDTESIIQIDENTYQVRSSVAGKSYIIESGICECMGFRYRKDCSHIQAVKITCQAKRDAMIAEFKTYSKKQILQRAKIVIANLKQRGWKNSEEYEEWRSHISSWREELVILGPLAK